MPGRVSDVMTLVVVTVAGGIVRLDGRVARDSQARLTERLAGGVSGVAAVDNHLRSDLDDAASEMRSGLRRCPM